MWKIQLSLMAFLCLLMTHASAQLSSNNYRILDKVEKALAKSPSTPEYSLVSTSASGLSDQEIPNAVLEEGLILELDYTAINAIRTQQPEVVQLSFPLPKQQSIKLSLVKNQVLAPDFILRQSSDPDAIVDYTPGLYYTGVISDDPNSLVSISIFEDEIMGGIHTSINNYTIGKLENSTGHQHIIYNDQDLNVDVSFECYTEDDGGTYTQKDLTFDMSKNVGDCVRVYFEIDDDIVTDKGGVTGATNFLTGLMNEVITLYANDNMDMTISEIKAWDTPAPYSGSSANGVLVSYQNNTGTFNGDLSHLISYQASGGYAAGFDGLCNSSVAASKCYSSVQPNYSSVPTFSFTVEVVTHEMGHLIGSRHTHACVWNGNNTAIDGCAGGTEGSCSVPGSPPGGGTIMSYCHNTTGIDFTQGFGSQPRAVMLNKIAAASCLSPCSSGGPTCTDGIQNGDETGVDCGGTSCPPCNSGCTNNEITVNFVFDNYPSETTWDIKNSSGAVVESGGAYPNQSSGSSLTIPLCLVDDCYDFTIYDSYGDGICCGYGSGSYSVLNSSGVVLASGGNFGSSETTNFCLSGGGGPITGCTDPNAHNYNSNATQDDGTCQTCSDGIQNGDETNVDCGGNLCSPCNGGGGSVFAHYFETGWDGWIDGGSDCYRYYGPASAEGSYSIRLRDNSGVMSSMTSSSYNMSGFSSANLSFYFYAYSMEYGEDFGVQVNSGSGWQTVAIYVSGVHFGNGLFYVANVTGINNLSSNTKFRIICDASNNADQVYIDAVILTGNNGAAIVGKSNTIEEVNVPIKSAIESDNFDVANNNVTIFPNPVDHFLAIETTGYMKEIKIYNSSGVIMQHLTDINAKNEELDTSDLLSGFYVVSVKTDTGWVNKKFVKL